MYIHYTWNNGLKLSCTLQTEKAIQENFLRIIQPFVKNDTESLLFTFRLWNTRLSLNVLSLLPSLCVFLWSPHKSIIPSCVLITMYAYAHVHMQIHSFIMHIWRLLISKPININSIQIKYLSYLKNISPTDHCNQYVNSFFKILFS